MDLQLYLSNSHGKKDLLPLKIKVFDHPLAKKWIRALEDLLEEAQRGESARTHLQKNYCFFGFPHAERNLPFLCLELNRFIDQVNDFSRKEGWASYRPYYLIHEHFEPEMVYRDGILRQDLMNKLHHHFELMMGQVWSRSEFFKDADDETRFALVQINHLCHEIEALVKAQICQEKAPHTLSPLTMFSMLEPNRKALSVDDLQYFQFERRMGLVSLHYCQTSKPHYDAFLDQDERIHEQNVNGLRYFSAEFDIHWGVGPSESEWNQQRNAFFHWLRSKNLDPYDPQLGLGWAYVGEVDLTPFGPMKSCEIHRLLEDYQDIAQIVLTRSDKELALNFPYSWKDPNYLKHQLKLFSDCEEEA